MAHPAAPTAVATATFNDTWAGDVPAFLLPQKTTRRGNRVTVYRWITERGVVCDGFARGHAAAVMVGAARRDARFSSVAAA